MMHSDVQRGRRTARWAARFAAAGLVAACLASPLGAIARADTPPAIPGAPRPIPMAPAPIPATPTDPTPWLPRAITESPEADTTDVMVPAMDAVDATRPGDPDSVAALRANARGVDYLWVLRDALVDPASIDSVVARSARMGVRGLLVQVVGRGDAYYASKILPRAEALGSRSDADPFEHLVRRANASGLEVHAWVNALLVWSSRLPPKSPRHVIRAHPEWVATLKDGRRMSRLGPKAMRRLRVEGAYLAAAHPGVRQWVASVAAEIAANYDVAGIHLDYIRQPDAEVGYDPTTRARFAMEFGVDPGHLSTVPANQLAGVKKSWRAFQREQITNVVRAVRDSVDRVHPGIRLSAAVVADTSRSEGSTAQSWRPWVRDGLVDRVYPMCYAPAVQTVMDQLVSMGRAVGVDDRIVPGIAVYNTSPATAAVKIKGARAMGYPLLALYSYDSLFAIRGAWSGLERGLEPAAGSDPTGGP